MGDHKTILLVEDTPELLETLRQVLEAAGYEVVCASDGKSARRCFAERPQKVDLLITDMFIGDELGGQSLAAELRREDADLCVILISGGGVTLSDSSMEFIQKPFSGKALLEKVRAVLV